MADTQPDASIIIPTHNRLAILLEGLAALTQQDCSPDEFEVIVVADGCDDGTGELVVDARYPFRCRVLSQPGAGAAAARNRGASVAHGRILIFLDDDVIASPGLVREHLAAHRAKSRSAFVGPFLPASDRPTLFGAMMRDWWVEQFERMGRLGHRFTYRDFLSGNVSMPRAVFNEVRGFDQSFRSAGGEDYELGIRLLAAGVHLGFAPDASAEHRETMDVGRSFVRSRINGMAEVKIARAHPHVRETLPFHRPSVTRWIIRWIPGLGSLGAQAATRLLVVMERVRLGVGWTRVWTRLRQYWYWVGVADELGSRAALGALPSSLDTGGRTSTELID